MTFGVTRNDPTRALARVRLAGMTGTTATRGCPMGEARETA